MYVYNDISCNLTLKYTYVALTHTFQKGLKPTHSPCFFHVLKINDDDGQYSSSEGSTVEALPSGEGGESIDLDLEESVEPSGCFPEGEHFKLIASHLNATLANSATAFLLYPLQPACRGSSVARSMWRLAGGKRGGR